MKTVNVRLNERGYPIHVGRQLIERSDLFRSHIPGSTVFVVSNETVAPLFAKTVCNSISQFAKVEQYIMPDGEIYKNLETASRIFDEMLSIPCDRKTTIVALGGGVVGDISGFVAASYQRGIPYIQVPTTLLAQVDSSIGGKTGVNHPLGKNMIGAIYQPRCVIADINTLDSLPEREFLAGLAEVIKYGLIRDREFFDWLENNVESMLVRDPDSMVYAIERSCATKAQVVELDERELGIRATLNLGHTFGHAIETILGYKDWLHGEAVAAGMVIAADFSYRLGFIDVEQSDRVKRTIGNFKLPVAPPKQITEEDFLAAMALDKKVDDGKIRFVILKGIGQAAVIDQYPIPVLHETLAACLSS